MVRAAPGVPAAALGAWLLQAAFLPVAAQVPGLQPGPAVETVVAAMVGAPAAIRAQGLAAALALELPVAPARAAGPAVPSPLAVARRSQRIAGAALLAYLQAARADSGATRAARAEALSAQLLAGWRDDRRRAELFAAQALAVRAALGASLLDALGLEQALARLAAMRARQPVGDAAIEPAGGGAGVSGEVQPVPATFGAVAGTEGAAPSPDDGLLTLPVTGVLVQRFGELDRGLRSRGVAFLVPASGPVVAPRAGRVVFAGPFKGFGLLLIIGHDDGYHTLLSGMSRLDVQLGQRVGRGQPVGLMAVDSGTSNRLYMELRRSGEPIDPMPSLAAREDKVRG